MRAAAAAAALVAAMVPAHEREGEAAQESHSNDAESRDDEYDMSGNSGAEESVVAQPPAELQVWPLIQVVEPPPWLPPGWTAVLRTRENGSKDKYYVDPQSGRRFRSKTEVNYYLETGMSYRYKRRMKEAGVGPPNTSGRGRTTDAPNARDSVHSASFTTAAHAEHTASHYRHSLATDLIAGPGQFRTHPNLMSSASRGGYRGPRTGNSLEDAGRLFLSSGDKRNMNAGEERKVQGNAFGTDNRGKLIVKLKRKTAEPEEGRSTMKKPRPFEVVGSSSAQAKLRMYDREDQLAVGSSSFQSKDRMNAREDQWAGSHAYEFTMSSQHASRRPFGKATPLAWQYPSHHHSQNYLSPSPVKDSNGQGHAIERPCGSASLSITDSENAKVCHKESPSEQLQRLGKRLCQQALAILSQDYASNGSHLGNTGCHSNGTSRWSNVSHDVHQSFHPVTTPAPIKRMRGSLPKEKSALPLQMYGGLDYHHLRMPQSM